MADTWKVIPAPPGLTVIDTSGKALPIVALAVIPDDAGKPLPDVRPLYVAESGSARLITEGLMVGMSESWLPNAVVPYEIPE
jgi:hypothetical protein